MNEDRFKASVPPDPISKVMMRSDEARMLVSAELAENTSCNRKDPTSMISFFFASLNQELSDVH
jgi:hypothetical protein